ncbi:CpaF family protein [Micrococcales bacterium 31B]|nr:CpaF family protein [Micrococcales bacterium 31B]
MEAIANIESEVRDLVRRRGMNPVLESAALDTLVAAVVADYDLRSLRGAVPRLHDADLAIAQVTASVGGLGPLQIYMDDPSVEEIWINSPSQIFVSRNGVAELTTTVLSHDKIRELVERMLSPTGRRIDVSSPFVDARLPDGSRLHVAIPEITRDTWAVNIRKFVVRAHRLSDLVRLGTVTAGAAEFLNAAVNAGLNVVVSGATGAGKTTLLNCLGSSIPARERVITCEEVFELQLPCRDQVALQCRQPNLEGAGEIALRRLIKEALRMRPQRIVVGEVREAECLDMLLALNSGMAGMSTIHANSARDAISKLCTLPMLAGPNVTSNFVVPMVASCIDLVIHVGIGRSGERVVEEILAVTGRVEGSVVETSMIFERLQGELQRREGYPPRPESFERAGFDIAALLGQAA